MKTYRCGRMENIIGDVWYTIQRRSFMGIWLPYLKFSNRDDMERVSKKLERRGNIVVRMN